MKTSNKTEQKITHMNKQHQLKIGNGYKMCSQKNK